MRITKTVSKEERVMDNSASKSQLWQIVNDRKKVRDSNQADAYNDGSRKKLSNIAQKKITTSFIGALNVFELAFGHLWGHGEKGPLTPEQEEYKKLWTHVRTEILNNGNNQIRNLLTEISQYTVTWERHSYNFNVKQD